MEIPIDEKNESGPLIFLPEIKTSAIGLVCSYFKAKEGGVYKVSAGCAVGQHFVLAASSVMKHGDSSPVATYLLRSSDYKAAMIPEIIEEFLSHKSVKLGSNLAKEDKGIALLPLPEGTCNPQAFELEHVTIADIFEREGWGQEIKVFGYSKAKSLESSLAHEEKKPGKVQEVLKIRDNASSTLQFLFSLNKLDLVGNPVTANGKVFAIFTGQNEIRLISEELSKFVQKCSLKAKEE